MKKSMRFNQTALLLIIVLSCFIISFTALNYRQVTSAEEVYIEDSVVRIVHMTDTHYYPLRYCYGGENIYSEYYTNRIADTKLLAENSLVFKELLSEIRSNGANVDYMVLTGDLAKDGERASHIDIANALRKLQNDIRADGNPDFQIFVTMGNHDMYNPNTCTYGNDGEKKPAPNVTRKDISIIYSSLGYPDITKEQAMEYYTQSELAETLLPYEKDEDSFINSVTAEKFNIVYMYDDSKEDYGIGELTYIATSSDGVSFIAIDEEDSNAEDGHLLTATVTEEVKAFIRDNVDSSNRLIAMLHHNIVPQNPLEPTLLAGFIVNDWVNVTDFLADLGIRYAFTGHMHANSISHHISFNNNQITDIETAAAVSYAGGVRYTEISYGTYGEHRAENVITRSKILDQVDFTYLFDHGYLDNDYIELNNVGKFMNGKICIDISEYCKYKIYDNVIDNYMMKYLSPNFITELIDMVKDKLPDKVMGLPMKSIKELADKIINNLIAEIENKVLDDYVYKGNNPLYQNGNNKLLGYLEEIVNSFRSTSITSDGKDVVEIFFYCYYLSIDGNYYESIEELPAFVREALDKFNDGSVAQLIFDLLLDENSGVYRLIKGLLTVDLDLSTGLNINQVNSINLLVNGLLGVEDFDIKKANLDALAMSALSLLEFDMIDLGEGTILNFIDNTIADYFTKSLTTGLGEIAANIMTAFAVDQSANTSYQNFMHVRLSEDHMNTYIDIPRKDNPTIANGKLPSMINVNFGEDASTTKNFVWFTDKRVNTSEIRYSLNADMSEAKTVRGEFDIYAHTYAQIDVGIFATYGVSEIGRHTVSVTGLTPNTRYYYQLGSAGFGESGYYSPIYTMKTAPSANAAFEALLISDPQGYTAKSYSEIFDMLNDIDSVFTKGYDFVISCGDNVDNSANMAHYNYLFDTDQAFWANTTFVTATGNHEISSFEKGAYHKPSSGGVITAPYNNSLLYFNISAPDQDKSKGIYYSFDYSGAHFTVLNTNDLESDGRMSAAQAEWLIADLKSTDKHKVVLMHKSLYSSGSHSFDNDVIKMREQLTPIFGENGVSLVLAGHDHTYSYTYYLDSDGNPIKGAMNGKSKISGKGTLYVTLGTVGNKFYGWKDNDSVQTYYGEQLHDPELSNPIFARLIYDGKDLYFEAYQYDLKTGEIKQLKAQNSTFVILTVVAGGAIALAGGITITVVALKKKKALIAA